MGKIFGTVVLCQENKNIVFCTNLQIFGKARLLFIMCKYVFLLATAIELAMGLLFQGEINIAFSRYILWGLFACYVLAAADYTIKEKDIKRLVVLIIAETLGVLVYVNSGMNIGIKAPVYIYAMSTVSKEKNCKILYAVILIVSAALFISCVIFDTGTMYVHSKSGRGINGLRYTLGYINPNRTTGIYLIALYFFMLEYSRKISRYGYLLLMAVILGIYFITYSRTALIIAIFIVTGCYIVEKSEVFSKRKWITSVLLGAFIISFLAEVAISVMAAAGVDNSFMVFVDKVTTGRIEQLGVYEGNEGYALPYIESWKLFGSKINKCYCDLGYVEMFYSYGVILTVCNLLFMMYAAFKAYQKEQKTDLIVLIGASMFLFMESLYISNYLPLHVSFIICALQFNNKIIYD